MSNYSYSKELNINKVTFREFDLNDIREIFTKIFESYNPKPKYLIPFVRISTILPHKSTRQVKRSGA